MNKPRRWLPLLIWLGKQWINGGSLGVKTSLEGATSCKMYYEWCLCPLKAVITALNHKILLLGYPESPAALEQNLLPSALHSGACIFHSIRPTYRTITPFFTLRSFVILALSNSWSLFCMFLHYLNFYHLFCTDCIITWFHGLVSVWKIITSNSNPTFKQVPWNSACA